MKSIRVTVVGLLLAVAASTSYGETVRLSWSSCDPWNRNSDFVGPGLYSLVLSAIGCNGPYVGHESVIEIAPGPIPDAWRFDDAGCQTSNQMALNPNFFSKSCPTISPTYDIQNASASYVIDGHAGYARLVVGVDSRPPLRTP